jgi:hypothetical protein
MSYMTGLVLNEDDLRVNPNLMLTDVRVVKTMIDGRRLGVDVAPARRREDDSALNPRWFFVNRVRQQQNGSAEKQCVEEEVQRNYVGGRGQEHRQVDP